MYYLLTSAYAFFDLNSHFKAHKTRQNLIIKAQIRCGVVVAQVFSQELFAEVVVGHIGVGRLQSLLRQYFLLCL